MKTKNEIEMDFERAIAQARELEEIAKELGVYEQVKQDGGWGNIQSKTCGNIVSKAIEIANRTAMNS